MNIILRFACCLVAAGIGCASARAQATKPHQALSTPTASVPGLAAAVDAAWQRAVAAREALGQQQRAEADRTAASSLWAAPPTLELNHRNDRWQTDAGRRETEIGLAWPLWLPGQRDARGAVAESGLSLAEQSLRVVRLRVAGEVRESAWALIAEQAEVAQAEALVRSLAGLAEDVDRRVKAGDLARADALAARSELLGASARLAEARHRAQAARSRWTLLTGLDVPASADEAPARTAQAITDHPEYRLASAASEHARRRTALARVSRSEPPEIIIGMRQDTPGPIDAAQNSLSIGIRLPLGTADRNRPLQAAALAELDIAETAAQRTRDRLESEAATARAALQASEQQLQAESSRAGLLRERATLIEKSFRAGESGLPELLRAMAAAAQTEAALARQEAALGLARARLHQSLGLMP